MCLGRREIVSLKDLIMSVIKTCFVCDKDLHLTTRRRKSKKGTQKVTENAEKAFFSSPFLHFPLFLNINHIIIRTSVM